MRGNWTANNGAHTRKVWQLKRLAATWKSVEWVVGSRPHVTSRWAEWMGFRWVLVHQAERGLIAAMGAAKQWASSPKTDRAERWCQIEKLASELCVQQAVGSQKPIARSPDWPSAKSRLFLLVVRHRRSTLCYHSSPKVEVEECGSEEYLLWQYQLWQVR